MIDLSLVNSNYIRILERVCIFLRIYICCSHEFWTARLQRIEDSFCKDFFGILNILEHPFFSEQFPKCNSTVVHQQTVDCIRATLLKGNSTSCLFLMFFQVFGAAISKLAHEIILFSRVLGCKLQSCLFSNSDSTRDIFLKFRR